MPYKVVVKGARYAALPVLLQNTMTFSFGTDILGELINPVTLPYAKLNNHKATLSFKPATAADEAALLALLPEGQITDPSQLPSAIPAYLIYVIPEISVSEQVVARGNAMQLGQELDFGYHIQRRGQPAVDNYNYKVTAGSYLNLAIVSGSVSPTKLTELQTKLTATQTILQSGDATSIASLTREDILGDMFYAGGLGYWGQYLALSHLQVLASQTSFDLPNGYGSFGYEPNVTRLFGFPRTLKPGGVAVNVRVSWNNIPKDGDMSKWKGLNLQAGMLTSILESAVPEQMFNTDPANPIDGISAVKALQLAAQQGQKIYQITPQNQATVLPQLTLSGLAMKEIRQGLAAGKEVIAHANQVSVPGFTGEGYIITDPVTGSGAYKISGGGNGGFIFGVVIGALLAASLLAAVIFALGGSLLGLLIAAIAVAAFTYIILEMQNVATPYCINSGFLVGVSFFIFLLKGIPFMLRAIMFLLWQTIGLDQISSGGGLSGCLNQ